MEWKVIDLKSIAPKKFSGSPFVSITPANGSFAFNAAACDLIQFDSSKYIAAVFLVGEENGKTEIAVRLLKEPVENSVSVRAGRSSRTFAVYNRGVYKTYIESDSNVDPRKSIKFPVKKIDDETFLIVR